MNRRRISPGEDAATGAPGPQATARQGARGPGRTASGEPRTLQLREPRSPAWSLLFAQAGAVVTDGGGVLAHAAVIAREYGIPAVLATRDATRRLHDGEIVTVDGTAGLVRTHAGNASG